MFTLEATLEGSNYGGSFSIFRVTPGSADRLLFRLAGTSNSPTAIDGEVALVGGGLTTKWNQPTLFFQATVFRIVYTSGNAARPNLVFNFEIAAHKEGMDLDNDGFIWPSEDCCDTHRASGGVPSCLYPTKVNIGAIEVANNHVIDSGSGIANCNNMDLDVAPTTSCSSRTCNGDCTPTELAQAMDICSFPTGSEKYWGVVSSDFLLADGSGSSSTPCRNQFGVQSSFAQYYGSGSTNPAVNSRFAVVSSGRATAAAGGVDDSICSKTRRNNVPSAYISKHGGNLETANNCPTGSSNVYESASLRLRIRAPTNAKSFSYRLMFLSQEFPYYVCTQYNDMFLALLSSFPAGFPAPADTNVATAPIPSGSGTQTVPLSINIEKFFTICQASNSYGTNCNPTAFSTMLSGSAYRYSRSGQQWGAGTALLTNTVNVSPGSTFSIDFLIFDTGDYKYQSTAILDSLTWNAEASPSGSGVSLEDLCPTDPLKTEPLICGCGVADVDTDGDGVYDCHDGCPTDPSKTTPGYCGCNSDDSGYFGWDAYCFQSNQCCIKRGYLGGTIQFAPTEATRSNEVEFTTSMFLERDDWCLDTSSNKFRRCSTVNSGGNPEYPTVGSVLPSLTFNYGVTCPASGYALTTCSSAYDYVNDSPTLTGTFSTVSGASSAFNSNYLLASPTQASHKASFALPVPAAGLYFVQIHSVAPSTVTGTLSRIKYTIFYNGGASNAVVEFTQNVGSGFRTLGSYAFTGTGNERIEATAVNVGSFVALVDAVRIVSYNPNCDSQTLTVSANAPVTRYLYVPAGQTFSVEATAGTCDPDIAVGTNVVPTFTPSLFSVDNSVGSANVRIVSTGATYVIVVQVKSGSSCSIPLKFNAVHDATVTNYDSFNNLITVTSQLAYQYPPRNCLSNPAPWIATYEGIARSRGSDLGRSFRAAASVAIPQTSGLRTSPSFSLPPILVVKAGTSTPFQVTGPPASSLTVAFNTAVGCSATYFPAAKRVSVPNPAGSAITGSASTNSLALSMPGSLASGYYTVCLIATDTATGTVTPFDFLVQIQPTTVNKPPAFTEWSATALQDCPSFALAKAVDPDAGDTVEIDYVNLPFTPTSVTRTTPQSNGRTIRLDFTPTVSGPTSVFLSAHDSKGGYGYLNLPINVLGLENRGCPSTSNGICNGQGTCNCDGTCTCSGRYGGADCSTYLNNAPVLPTTQILMTENVPLNNFQLMGTDAEGDSITYAFVSKSSSGATISVSSSGVVSITTTPYYHTNGQYSDSFVVRLTDNAVVPKSATYTVSLGITHVNNAPTTAPFSTSTQQGCAAFTGTLTANDVDGDSLTFTRTGTPQFGSLTINAATGVFTYTCTGQLHGNESVSFSVSDGNGGTASSVINIYIAHVNQPPVAQALDLSGDQDTVISGTLTGTDPEGDALTYRVSTQPSSGTVVITNADTGAFTYTPAPNKRGTVTFQYVAVEKSTANKLSSAPATVSIFLIAVNHAPVPDNYMVTILEDSSYSGTLSATDIDGDALTFSMNTVPGLVFTAPNSFVYTPPANSVSTMIVSFWVSDGALSTAGSVTILVTPVNDPPTFSLIETMAVNANQGAQTVDNFVHTISMGPADESSQAVKAITVTTSNPSLFTSGPSINNAGRLTYTLAPFEFGTAVLSVRVQDNGGVANGGVDTSVVKTSTLTVRFVNQRPSFVLASSVTVAESSGAASVVVASSMSVGPANEAAQTFNFEISHSCDISAFATFPQISTAGVISFTPTQYRFFSCVLSVRMVDNGGTANGGADTSAPQSITITVTPVNDPPTFTAAFTAQTVLEDAGAQSFDFASAISPGPLESDPVAFVITNTNPSLFSVAPAVHNTTGKLTFTSAPFANGVAVLTIRLAELYTNPALSSASVLVTITVTPVNNPPTFTLSPTTLTVNEDSVFTPTVFATALSPGGGPDEASQTLSFAVTHNCGAGLFSTAPTMTISGTSASLAFALAADANTGASSCTLSLKLTDSGDGTNSVTKTLTFKVNPVNDAPTFVPGTSLIGLDDATSTTYSAQWGTSLSAGPADESAQTLSFVMTNSNPGLFTTAPTLVVSGSTATLAFVTPAASNGEATLTVRLKDNGGTALGGEDTSDPVTIRIVVSASDLPITYNMDSAVTVAEDSGAFSKTNFISSIDCGAIAFKDSVAASLTIVSSSVSPSLLFSSQPTISVNTNSFSGACVNGVATLSFTGAPHAFGWASISVSLRSDRSVPVFKTFLLTITPVNDPPSFTLNPTSISQPEDIGAYSYAGIASSISAGPFNEAVRDNQFVWFTLSCNAAANNLFSVMPAINNVTGTLTYTSAPYAYGSTVCSVVLHDNLGSSSAPASLTLTLTPVNNVPSFTLSPSHTVLEDAGAVTVAAFATDLNPGPNEEDQTLSFAVSAGNPALFAVQPTISGTNGELKFTTAADAFGSTVVTAVLTDSEGAEANPKTFTITITPVNDQPAFSIAASTVTRNQNAGTVTVTNFFSAVSPGPANEAGQSLGWTITSSNSDLFATDGNGNILLSVVNNADLSFTAKENHFGTATITVVLKDNGGTANGGIDSRTRTFTIAIDFVNQVPFFTLGSDQTVLENAGAQTVSAWATGISAGTPLETSQTVSFTVEHDGSLLSSVAVSPAGVLTFTPIAYRFGSTDVSVKICDSLELCSASREFTVNVLPVNQAPTFTVTASSVDMVEDGGQQNKIAFSSMSPGPWGEDSQSIQFITSVVSCSLPELCTVAPYVTNDGAVVAQPGANAFGTIKLSVVLKDNGGVANGGVDTSAPVSLTINVLPVNDQPQFTISMNPVVVLEDSGASSIASVLSSISPGPFESSQTVSFVIDSVTPSNLFSVQPTISSDGTLSFTLPDYVHGTATVLFHAVDDGGVLRGGVDRNPLAPASASLTISVTNVDHAPIALPDSYTFNENTSPTLAVTENDYSVDGDSVTVWWVSPKSARGASLSISSDGKGVVYTNVPYTHGADSFNYIATDSTAPHFYSENVTVSISITHINHNPTCQDVNIAAVEDVLFSQSAPLALSGFDVDGDAITFVLSGNGQLGAASLVAGTPQTFRYQSSPYQCGVDMITYRVRDTSNAQSSFCSAIVNVACVNNAPTASDLTFTMEENTLTENKVLTINVDATDKDAEDVPHLVYVCTSAPTIGSLNVALNTAYPVSSPILYNPAPFKNGLDSFDCFVRDPAGLTGNFNVKVTVTGPDNHPPVISLPYLEIVGTEDVPGSGQLNALDYDGEAITFSIVTQPDARICTISLNSATGAFTYTPKPNANGNCGNWTWRVTDARGMQSETNGVVLIRILPVNDAPVVLPCSVTAYEDATTTNLQLNGTDVDLLWEGDTLTFLIINQPSHGLVTLNDVGKGLFTYEGTVKDWFGVTYLQYRLRDAAGLFSPVGNCTINVLNVNDPPTTAGGHAFVAQNTQVTTTIPYVDIDTALPGMTFAVVTHPAHGTVTASGLGNASIKYVPRWNYYGMDSFVYSVNDGQYTVTGTFTVNVTFVNQAPVANSTVWTIPANSVYEDLAPGSDVDSPILTAELVGASPTKGTATFIGGQMVRYEAAPSSDPDYTATDVFSFRLFDGALYSNTATITVNIIRSENAPPVAIPGSVSVLEGGSVTSQVSATDADNDALVFALVAQPLFGSLTFNSDGTFTYQAVHYRRGSVTFSFRARDAFYSSSTVLFTINIIPVNHPPLANDVSATTLEDTPVSGTLIGQDLDGDAITFSFENGGNGQLGSAVITSGNAFTYTPRRDMNGVDTIKYRTHDGVTTSELATLTVNVSPVNDAPVAYDQSNQMYEDQSFSGFLVATDVDSPKLTFSLDDSVRSVGVVSLNSETGAFTYTPPLYFHGSEAFRFIANDGSLNSNVAEVTMVIIHVNHAPVAHDNTASTLQNEGTTVELTGFDVDGDAITFALASAKTVQGGTITLNGAVVTYTPVRNFNGVDSFKFTTYDGALSSAPGTITIDVAHVNQPPTVNDDTVSVVAGVTTVITVSASDIDTPISGLSLIVSSAAPTLGSVSLAADPPLSFNYVAGSATGVDTVVVKVSDGEFEVSGTITVYVTSPAVRPPRVTDMYITGSENVRLTGKLTTVFNSAPIVKYLVSSVSPNMNFTSNSNLATGDFELEFKPYWYGTATFQYRAEDANMGISNYGTVTVVVNHVNHAPEARDGAFTVASESTASYTLEGSDIDGDDITAEITRANELVGHDYSLDPQTRLFTITPKYLFSGQVTLQFVVKDAALRSPQATLNITVTPINHAPTARDYTFTVVENTQLTASVEGSDVDGNTLTYSAQSMPARGTLQFNADGTFVYTPLQYQRTTATFTYIASDGFAQSAAATVTIEIDPVNQIPTVSDSSLTVTEGSVNNPAQLTGYDVEDGTRLTYVLLTTPLQGTISLGDFGAYTYTPRAYFPTGHSNGYDGFTFTAYDANGAQANTANVTITVLPVQNAPIAHSAFVTLDENTNITGVLTSTDNDNDPVTYHVKFTARNGVFTLDSATGAYTYTPTQYFNGQDLVSFSVNDGIVDSNVANLIITVRPVNQAPVAYDANFTVKAGESYVGNFMLTDIDKNDAHTARIVQAPSSGLISIEGLRYVFSVDAGVSARTDVFQFRVRDRGDAESNTATITVTILEGDPSTTTPENSNEAGVNIAGAAVGGVIAAIAAVAILFFLYRQNMLRQSAALNMKQLTTEMDVYDNPLYQTLTHESTNPLYSAPGEAAEVFSNPAFSKDTPVGL